MTGLFYAQRLKKTVIVSMVVCARHFFVLPANKKEKREQT